MVALRRAIKIPFYPDMAEPDILLVIPVRCISMNYIVAIAVLVTSLGVVGVPVAASARTSSYTLNLERYFPSAATERRSRSALTRKVQTFLHVSPDSLDTAKALNRWLNAYDMILKGLRRHDDYLYLRSEEDVNDREDAVADSAVGELYNQVQSKVRRTLLKIGLNRLRNLLSEETPLQRYRYFIESSLRFARHMYRNEKPVILLAHPALTALGDSYSNLRRQVTDSWQEPALHDRKGEFESRWRPFMKNRDAFAALLIPIAVIRNGKAELQGFPDAPEAAYFYQSIPGVEVNKILVALRSSSAYRDYQSAVADAAARRLKIPKRSLHAWDLQAADGYTAPPRPASVAVRAILAAVRPMGSVYADAYSRLFNPESARVELCRSKSCDHAGFSVGFSGTTSGLFLGGYDGSLNSMRALAHEAGHAVHRQFMNENQPLAVYNAGPKFMFESFAVFNGLLFLDHMYESATSNAARAYYLHQFLHFAIFQVYGSAEQTDLEQSIYAGVKAGTIRTAADLDALTLRVLSRYLSAPEMAPEMQVYWAQDSLYYTDPLYDVNYLFAGLLALRYFQDFKEHPNSFPRHYVALLKSGFTDTPQALEKKFLNIDLANTAALVRNANAIIEQRTAVLERLYRGCGEGVSACGR